VFTRFEVMRQFESAVPNGHKLRPLVYEPDGRDERLGGRRRKARENLVIGQAGNTGRTPLPEIQPSAPNN
jgi:hypothetical protein